MASYLLTRGAEFFLRTSCYREVFSVLKYTLVRYGVFRNTSLVPI